MTLDGLKKLKKGTYTASELQDIGVAYKVKITIIDEKFLIDLTDNPP